MYTHVVAIQTPEDLSRYAALQIRFIMPVHHFEDLGLFGLSLKSQSLEHELSGFLKRSVYLADGIGTCHDILYILR